MKKYVLAVIAVFTMSMAFAQAPQEGFRPQLSNKNKTELAQKRTDKMVRKYGLNDKQAKELLALNTEYQGKIGIPGGKEKGRRMHTCDCPCCKMMMEMMQQCMQHNGPRPEMNDSAHKGRMPMMQMNDSTHKGRMPMMQMGGEKKIDRAKMEEMMKERKAAREEYNAKLAKIMNKKQFSQYQQSCENKLKNINSDNK